MIGEGNISLSIPSHTLLIQSPLSIGDIVRGHEANGYVELHIISKVILLDIKQTYIHGGSQVIQCRRQTFAKSRTTQGMSTLVYLDLPLHC